MGRRGWRVSTFDDLVDSVLQTLHGYGLAQPRATFLSAGIDADDTQLAVRDASDFEQGVAEIDNETIFIESVDFDNNILTVSPDGRGYYGSTAATHANNARVTMAPVWPRSKVAEAVNETIVGTYPDLFATVTTSFAYSPAVTTYSLPAAAEKVIRVTTDTIGPSREQLTVNRYSFNVNASGSDFATGRSITLEKGAFPGRNVNVTYVTAPAEITFGDDFTDSGLAETAKRCIKYGVCSSLILYMDPARLPVNTAQADEYDPSRNAIGTATKLSANLYQRYLVELDNERRRQKNQATISVRTR
jgi:hypothetical protein